MTELVLQPCLVFQHEWKITGIHPNEPFFYSKRFVHQETELFRARMMRAGFLWPTCLNYPMKLDLNPDVKLSFLTTNLKMMGLKISSVSYFKHPVDSWKEDEMNEEDLGAPGIQLFTTPLLNIFETGKKFPNFTFKFALHITGTVNRFCLHQMDKLLSEQLLSSVITEGTPDFKLIASDGNCLPVHKWMLAARSPVFADLFDGEEDLKSIHLAEDCNVTEMKQFVKFICTGELEGLLTENLKRLAVKYRIKTLEYLCQTGFHDNYDFLTDELAETLFPMDEPRSNQLKLKLRKEPDEDLLKAGRLLDDTTICKCSWNVTTMPEDKEIIKMNVPFEHKERKLFRAEFVLEKSVNRLNDHRLSLKFLSHGHGSIIGCEIDGVTCSIRQEQESSSHQLIKMIKAETDQKKLLQIFTATKLIASLSCPFVITFYVELRYRVPNYVNKLIDSAWIEEIWASAVNRKMTDVEFLVGEETFGAHRSLLSVRSPVFAAMFESGMKEAETGRVRIEDVDPGTFQRFLKFLYTGMVEPYSSEDGKLSVVADKYGVKTLMELCRLPVTKQIDNLDDVFSAFFCC